MLRIGCEIARGLAAAHAVGLIHRDIKPANILLEDGAVPCAKLIDFGLARAADDASITQSGLIPGTPLYMAPEQARGQALDQRADLFSLGSVLYVMCSGRPPFRASTSLAVLNRVAEDTPRPIWEIIPEVPNWLCAIIAKLHAKNPDERFASANEVAELLACHLAELQQNRSPQSPVPATVATAASPLPPAIPLALARKRRRTAPAVVVLLLLVGLGLSEAIGVTHFRGAIIRLFSPEGTLVTEKRERLDVQLEKPASPGTPPEKALIAAAGFNNHRGMNSTPVPGSPYCLDCEGKQGGAGEPGWAGPWSTLSAPGFSFQKKVIHEGDGALYMCKEGADRQLAEAQRGQFQVEMFIQVPERGGTGCYLKNGSGAFRDGPVWSVGTGSFRVMDGHNNWRQTDLTYELGKWHKVSLRVDVTHRHWQFFVDDKKFENPRGPLLFRSNEASLDTIRLQCENETGIYIDALRFTQLPDAAGKD